MALITCPECNKEVSESATACPHCGYPLKGSPDSHDILAASSDTASQAVEVTGVRVGKKGKRAIALSVAALLIVAIATLSIRLVNEQNAIKQHQSEFNTYVDSLGVINLLSLGGAAKSETLNNLTARVWYNAIYKESDSSTNQFTRPYGQWVESFNDALKNLSEDPETINTRAEIEANREIVRKLWREMQDPPTGLEKCYDVVSQMYDSYDSLTSLAISPSGNLTTFSQKKNDLVAEYLKYSRQLDDIIPEKLGESKN